MMRYFQIRPRRSEYLTDAVKIRDKKAASLLEYTVLLVIIMGGFILMGNYIVRGFSGRWKEVGDSFGFGRQFDPDPNVTEECIFFGTLNQWYNTPCLRQCAAPRPAGHYTAEYAQCIVGCNPIARRGPCSVHPYLQCLSCCQEVARLGGQTCLDQCDSNVYPKCAGSN